MYEHMFAEPYLQGFQTGKQNNTLGEQCQIWNSANVLVKIMEGKIEHIMLAVILNFFSVYNLFFQCCKTIFTRCRVFKHRLTGLWNFFRFELWQDSNHIEVDQGLATFMIKLILNKNLEELTEHIIIQWWHKTEKQWPNIKFNN